MPQKQIRGASAFSWRMATRAPGPMPSLCRRAATCRLCRYRVPKLMLSSEKMRAVFPPKRSAVLAIKSDKGIVSRFRHRRTASNLRRCTPLHKLLYVAKGREILRSQLLILNGDVIGTLQPEDQLQNGC